MTGLANVFCEIITFHLSKMQELFVAKSTTYSLVAATQSIASKWLNGQDIFAV